MRVVALADGLDGLVGLLDHVLRDAAMRLGLVPRAAVGLAEAPHGAHEPVEFGMGRRRAIAAGGLGIYAAAELGKIHYSSSG